MWSMNALIATKKCH